VIKSQSVTHIIIKSKDLRVRWPQVKNQRISK